MEYKLPIHTFLKTDFENPLIFQEIHLTDFQNQFFRIQIEGIASTFCERGFENPFLKRYVPMLAEGTNRHSVLRNPHVVVWIIR